MTKKDWLILGGLTVTAALLRFLWLGHPHAIVFDETYFAKFAHNYLTGTVFFDAEPPLGKFLIAGGEWLFGSDPTNLINPFGWRFATALFGTLTIPLFYLLTKRLFGGTWMPTVAAGLALMDGLLLVESRVAVIDIFVVFFNLLTYLLFVLALQARSRPNSLAWLTGAGISLGLGLSVKWITLAFAGPALIALALLWFGGKGALRQLRGVRTTFIKQFGVNVKALPHPAVFVLLMLVLPLAIYYCLFAIHVPFDSTHESLWGIHKQIFNYHHNLQATHPYGSEWYSWPLSLRPVAYYFNASGGWWQGIVAIGNPLIWWGGLLSLLYLAYEFAKSKAGFFLMLCAGGMVFVFPIIGIPVFVAFLLSNWDYRKNDSLLILFVLFAWLAHFAPWSLIDRVLFIYHYLGALPFTIIALAYALRRNWDWRPKDTSIQIGVWVLLLAGASVLGGLAGRSWLAGLGTVPSFMVGSIVLASGVGMLMFLDVRGWRWGRKQTIAFLALCLVAFLFFLPIWTGIALPRPDYLRHMWLDSWI